MVKVKRTDYIGQVLSIRKFLSLSDAPVEKKAVKKPILLITTGLSHLSLQQFQSNQAMHFASVLGKNGFAVTLLDCDLNGEQEVTNNYVKELGLGSVVTAVLLTQSQKKVLNSPIAEITETSFYLNEWLKDNLESSSIVLAVNSSSELYYPLLQKTSGLSFGGNRFMVYTQNSSLYKSVLNNDPLSTPLQLNTAYMERAICELADATICGSLNYINWMIDNGYRLNDQSAYLQAPLVDLQLTGDREGKESNKGHVGSSGEINEFVFVANNEIKHECLLFLEAIKRLEADFSQRSIAVKLLIAHSVKKNAVQHYKAFAKHYKGEFNVELVSDSSDVLFHATLSSCVIIPFSDVFNTAVFTQLNAMGIPVLSNASTALEGECFNQEERYFRVFNHNPGKICQYLLHVLENREIYAAQNIDHEANTAQWLDYLQGIPVEQKRLEKQESPLVSVCIAHFNRPDFLRNAIRSIEQQTYKNIEIIVVDDGSTDVMACEFLIQLEKQHQSEFPLRVVRQENAYLGASRNSGLKAAQGDYVLFMDDDNEAMPEEVQRLLQAALHSQADIVTCFSDVFSGQSPQQSDTALQQALYVGPNLSTGLFSNPFGDSNMLVKRSRIVDMGGFSEYYKVGRDDQEFFVRAALNDYKIQLVPQALYWYRLSKKRMRSGHFSQYSGLARVAQTYVQDCPVGQKGLFRYTQGLSYLNGPWGASQTGSSAKHALREFARFILVKFPFLYRWCRRLYVKFF